MNPLLSVEGVLMLFACLFCFVSKCPTFLQIKISFQAMQNVDLWPHPAFNPCVNTGIQGFMFHRSVKTFLFCSLVYLSYKKNFHLIPCLLRSSKWLHVVSWVHCVVSWVHRVVSWVCQRWLSGHSAFSCSLRYYP